ncbi:glycosyltransferase [Sphingobium chlorophenolicum]|uniref:Putative ceramide glucosyltransferase n=1 Tax=Sphingobium chlorophenolicum TaxID=46429 RepID=A0A081RI88_SPHCR|nr:glycosyltransferase [Sphingobium chlorophenolicum]KEQ54911.1 putative ceramide glucosyltransferase precursor [Sphingobium chlorophenolicum]
MSFAFALWMLLQGLSLLGVLNYWRHLPVDRQEEAPEGVVLLLSVRDDWDGGAALIARLKAQTARFRLVIATSGGCAAAEALAAREGGWVQVVRAGVADDEGQKVHKLRAALRALRPEDRWLVFVDADILPPARLVGRLLFPLVRGKADIVTGYRLLLPEARVGAALVGAVEMQLATLPRAASATMPWGGAMALTREVAERLDLDAALAGRLSDDMAIGLAGWRGKLRLRPVRDLLVACPLEGAGAFGFGVRQYRHIVTNSGGMWGIAALVVAVQAFGWVWALGWGGWSAVALGYGAALARVLVRRRIVAAVVEPGQAGGAGRSLWWDLLAPFAVCWAHLGMQVVAVCSSRIRWGGFDYWVKRGKVVRMERVG